LIDVKLTGLDDIVKKFNKLPETVQNRVAAGAIRAAAKPIIEEAKRNVPVDTGNLRDSIRVVKFRTRKKNLVWFKISPTVNVRKRRFKTKEGKSWSITGEVANGWYGHFVEFGTHAGRTVALNKNTKYSRSRRKRRNDLVNRGSGTPARPFMRPAYENAGGKSIDIAKKYMASRVDKELAKL
jgi:HK97 gp10 family phage protein